MIYVDLFLGFLKVGLFAFGGAYGAIPLIRDTVLSYGWMGDDMLTNMIAVSESTPGPIMVNLATYVGSSRAGILGAIIATFAVVLPSFIIILVVTALFQKVIGNKYVQAALSGMKPCIIGIILATGCFMIINNCIFADTAATSNITEIVLTVLLAAVFFASRKVMKRGIGPIGLIIISAVCGIVVYGI